MTRSPSLTPSEQRSVSLMVQGLTAAAIGRKAGISEKTVKAQLQSAYRKLGDRNAAHAAYLWCHLNKEAPDAP